MFCTHMVDFYWPDHIRMYVGLNFNTVQEFPLHKINTVTFTQNYLTI